MSERKPLTLEELWEMDGKPVWATLIKSTCGEFEGWAIVYKDSGSAAVQQWTAWTLWYEEYGETWLAYARPRLNREAWEPCESCKSCDNCTNSGDYDPYEGYFGDCASCNLKTHSNFKPENFCHRCGRPLTEEAWTMLEKRIGG